MNQVAVVTGSNRGIGRAIALRFAGNGIRVVLTGRDQSALDTVAGEIGNAAAIALDLRIPQSAQQLVDFALAQFGRIDILVNNAGATKRGDFLTLTDDDWADGYALKLFGAVRLTRAAWPFLKAASGSLLNIAGVGGRTPGAEFTIGGSVNAALLSFTKAMSEVGIRDGVQVNAVSPGTIRTDRFTQRLARAGISESDFIAAHRIARIGEPEDIANLAAFITSPEGRLLQGSLIDMDAGATKTL
jgi:NAD(P)-dependent dehydrogenase (short-subunit alcohol dehydrogenase family)